MSIKDSAKTILCYGDSNTWGAIPRSDDRYPRSVRWTGVLQNLLGEDYEIISEGLCGRTFVVEDPEMPYRTGITHLRALLESTDPVDYLVIMLGTNDVKKDFGLSAEKIAEHLEQTIILAQDKDIPLYSVPKILVVCPPSVIIPSTNDLDSRMVLGPELFKKIPQLFKQVAEKYNCGYVDAGEYISSSKIDGYHLDPESHLKLAQIIKEGIIKISN